MALDAVGGAVSVWRPVGAEVGLSAEFVGGEVGDPEVWAGVGASVCGRVGALVPGTGVPLGIEVGSFV